MIEGTDEVRATAYLASASDVDGLRHLIRARCGREPDLAGATVDLPTLVIRMVDVARREGWLDRLAGAPEVPTGQPRPTSDGVAIARVASLQGFIDLRDPVRSVDDMQRALREARGRVFSIEVDGAHRGTGFLIGPDLALTNQHVITDLLAPDGSGIPTAPERAKARFDVVERGSAGRVIEFSADWLVAQSPPHRLDGTDGEHDCAEFVDALDFAVLRLDRPMGLSHAPGSRTCRGWYHLRTDARRLRADGRLLGFQHPLGIAMSYDEGRVLWVNGNDTRTRHSINTAPGSSGGPILDVNLDVVILHHSGDPSPGSCRWNQGIPIAAIVGDLVAKGLDALLTRPPDGPLPLLEISPVDPVLDRLALQRLVVDMCDPDRVTVLSVEGGPGTGRQFAGLVIERILNRLGVASAWVQLGGFMGSPPSEVCSWLASQLAIDARDMPGRPVDRQSTRWPKLLAAWLVGKVRERHGQLGGPTWLTFDCVDDGPASPEIFDFVLEVVDHAIRLPDLRVALIGAEARLQPRHLDRAERERLTALAPVDVARYLEARADGLGQRLARIDAEALGNRVFERLPATGAERWSDLVRLTGALVARLRRGTDA